jgi:hypothetical protein
VRKTFLSIVLLLLSQQSSASILGFQTLELNFKNQDEVSAKVQWSNKDKLNITSQGIGTSLDPAVVVNTSIETLGAFAVGYSWRPIQSAHVSVEISPPRRTLSLANGQTFVPSAGSFYVRYSPDAKHWSSWQVIELNKGTQKNDGSWKFDGQIGIPQKERKSYQDLLEQYHRMDVQWTSDEEAAVKWILSKDPNFFSRQIPFIGYLQFLFETTLNGGQRIEKIKINVAYGVSGLSTIPKDKQAEEGRNVPWRFRSE